MEKNFSRKRNRTRPRKGRMIKCPECMTLMERVSQKHNLHATTLEQLKEQGIARRNARLLLLQQTAVSLSSTWLEAFWCNGCQNSNWFVVTKVDKEYHLIEAELKNWKQSNGTLDPNHLNPSVSQFTLKNSKGTRQPYQ